MGSFSMQERCKDFASEFDSIFALATPDEQQRMRELLSMHGVQASRIDGLKQELGMLHAKIHADLVDVCELEAERSELLSALSRDDAACPAPNDMESPQPIDTLWRPRTMWRDPNDVESPGIACSPHKMLPAHGGAAAQSSAARRFSICSDDPSAAPDMSIVPEIVTTLSVHGIHGGFGQEDLVQLWPPVETGYNYIYLPFNIKQRRSTSYVFLNFVSWAAAEAFRRQCQGKPLQHGHRVKHLTVSTAKVQGLEANLRHCKETNVSKIHNADHLPAVFLGSTRLNFRSIIAQLPPRASTESAP